MTPFEVEVLNSILWQLKGFTEKHVTKRVTKRILRATLRRIKPTVIGRSKKLSNSEKFDRDHAVPLNVVVDILLSKEHLDHTTLKDLLAMLLVSLELTTNEHKIILKEHGLSSEMPPNWDGKNVFARYDFAGIKYELLHKNQASI